jgi:hypothetical protein
MSAPWSGRGQRSGKAGTSMDPDYNTDLLSQDITTGDHLISSRILYHEQFFPATFFFAPPHIHL